jgi:hypothetical protein
VALSYPYLPSQYHLLIITSGFKSMTRKWNYIYCLLLLGLAVGCKKPYNPEVISSDNHYLVVEGVINSGGDSTFIKLSQTVKLSEQTSSQPVQGAQVTVEGEHNDVHKLLPVSAGVYATAPLNLVNNQKYKLHIIVNGKEYASDFVEAKTTPAIDNVGYQIKTNGLQINVDTHDASDNTRYYRWDYVETYEFQSDFESYYKSNGDTVLDRDMVNDNIYTCWHTNVSSTINIGSSVKLAQDVIADAPISFIPAPSEKLVNKYSILVKQYALTKDAYQFWENLKKNTEQLGSIFDAQPSLLNGNIHCITNPAEPVVGYVSVSTVTNKRIFISHGDLPDRLAAAPNYGCQLDTFLFVRHRERAIIYEEDVFFNYHKSGAILAIPVQPVFNTIHALIGHLGATPQCVDCTLRGTNKQPSFWK